MGRRICCGRGRGTSFKLKESMFKLDLGGKFHIVWVGGGGGGGWGGLEQVAKRICGCLIPGGVQGQVG